jgi:phospholipid/cholesterol/gamma-HCH transport system permease protein
MADSTTEPKPLPLALRVLDRWGGMWNGVFALLGGIWLLLIEVATWVIRSGTDRQIRLGGDAVISQIVRVGVRSIGIVLLVSACIGLILAMAMQPPLDELGQSDKIANIVAVGVFRELGPLIAAIVLTGFAGASIAAEIGTMVVGEEIEALQAHALNPVRFLVVPRVIATILSLFLLTILGDVMAVFASGLVTVNLLGVPQEVYIDNTISQLNMGDFLTGLLKAATFGTLLSSIACYNGLKVTGGAAGVGKATTDTVVQTVVLVIVADMLFTAVFLQLGWT